MEIDLTRKNFSDTSETYFSLCRKQCKKLLDELNTINSKMCKRYNYIIVPISVYNILVDSAGFSATPSSIPVEYINSLEKVGMIGGFEVYLDIHMPFDTILMDWDKQTSRDFKIDSILEGTDQEKSITIDVIINY